MQDYQQDSSSNHVPQFDQVARQRRFTLLNDLILLLIPVTLFLSIFNGMVMTNFEVLFHLNSLLDAFVGMMILLIVYLINKRGHYHTASWTLIIATALTISIHVLLSQPPHLEMTHYFLLLMFAKPLLGEIELLATTVLIVVCVSLLTMLMETISIFSAWNIITFIVITYLTLRVISNFRSGLEKDRHAIVESSENHLRLLLNQVPAIVWLVDRNIQIQSLNGRKTSLIGDFSSYLTALCEACGDPSQNQGEVQFDYEWQGHYYQNIIQPQLDNRGQLIGYLGMTLDISERIENEAKALEIAKKQERQDTATVFLNTASHDIRTPLSVLNTTTYLLKKAPEKDRQRHLANLQHGINRLNKLFDDIFYIVKLDTQHTPEEPIMIHQILSDVLRTYQTNIEGKQISFSCQIDEVSDMLVMANAKLLKRAISNILDNALQYSSANGVIEFVAREQDNHIQMTVINDGEVISENHLPHIFDHFFRVASHRSLENNNIGLGLTITKKIIEHYHGTIYAESSEQTGTSITITLPKADALQTSIKQSV